MLARRPGKGRGDILTGMDAIASARRSYHSTPDRLVLLLLVAEVTLWLSDRAGWPAWHKGYAVSIAVAAVGLTLTVLLLWWLAALLFRWRFQFSLRSMLVMVVAVAVPCSWLAAEMKKAREQKTAVEAIERVGGHWVYGPENSGDIEDMIVGPLYGPEWLRILLGDDFFNEVKYVAFVSTIANQATNADLAHVAELKHLKVLLVGDTQITDAGLAGIAGLTELRELILICPKFTDRAMEHLTGLKKLRELTLKDTQVTDEGIKNLQRALPNCKIER